MTYACNVRGHPSHTLEKGDLDYIGSEIAPGMEKMDFEGRTGWWYSLPGEALCKDNKSLGDDGCTWKLNSKLKARRSMEDLVNDGFVTVCSEYNNEKNCVSKDTFNNSPKLWINNARILSEMK